MPSVRRAIDFIAAEIEAALNSLWKFVFYALAVLVGFCGVVGGLLVFGYQVHMHALILVC